MCHHQMLPRPEQLTNTVIYHVSGVKCCSPSAAAAQWGSAEIFVCLCTASRCSAVLAEAPAARPRCTSEKMKQEKQSCYQPERKGREKDWKVLEICPHKIPTSKKMVLKIGGRATAKNRGFFQFSHACVGKQHVSSFNKYQPYVSLSLEGRRNCADLVCWKAVGKWQDGGSCTVGFSIGVW